MKFLQSIAKIMESNNLTKIEARYEKSKKKSCTSEKTMQY